MLSRRNVRVKVMQTLYAVRQDPSLTPARASSAYGAVVDAAYDNLLFHLYTLVRVARESRAARERRSARLRPSEEDRAFRPHLYDNPLTLALANAADLSRHAADAGFADQTDEERLRGFYDAVAEGKGYAAYSTAEAPSASDHLGALLKANKVLVDNEGYNDYLEDRFARWDENKSLVVGATKKVLKALPTRVDLESYRTDRETRDAFGATLLGYVLDHSAELREHIGPVLQNWSAERVAALDMILLQMALAEFFVFPQIPPKVTLNEYVELAKLYSTEKSREFINGILDKLLHSLRSEGLIVKQGRGLID